MSDLQQQLDAANQRIADLEQRLEISGAISADVENDLRRELEAAKRKLTNALVLLRETTDKLIIVEYEHREFNERATELGISPAEIEQSQSETK